jgi:hypothetical protein
VQSLSASTRGALYRFYVNGAFFGSLRGVIQDFALLGCYASWVGSCLQTLRDNLILSIKGRAFFLGWVNLEDGANKWFRNVVNKLPTYDPQLPTRAKTVNYFDSIGL